MSEKAMKGVQDAVTGEVRMVELSAEEITEIAEKQAASTARRQERDARRAAALATVAVFPTAAEVEAAKTVADLREAVGRMQAVVALLLEQYSPREEL